MERLVQRKSAKRIAERVTFSSKWRQAIRRIINAQLKPTTGYRQTARHPLIGVTRRFSKRDSVWKRERIAPGRSPAFTRSSKKEHGKIGHANSFGFTRRD